MNAGQIFGRGISFPPRVGPDGRVAWSEGEVNVRESIRVILMTEQPERLRTPKFGGSLGRFLFEPNTVSTRRSIQERITRELAQWEPRIRVESVNVDPDPSDPQAAIATITYKLVATQAVERVSVGVSLGVTRIIMPLQIPSIDDRRYQDLLNEALARIPVHNPEWTNFNKSDPGVTLLELFAFLTENLLYRSNQIPERNRRKFLQLLGVPLHPASSALGLVSFNNDRGPLETITLNSGLEVRAGQVPFRTDHGLDVLPIEAAVYYKRQIVSADTQVTDYYKLLYASYQGQPPNDADIQLYQSVPIDGREGNEVAIGQDATDRSAWIALMVRASDKPIDDSEAAKEDLRNKVREAIAGKTISLGIVPAIEAATRRLAPGGSANPEGEPLFQYLIPNVRSDGLLPTDPAQRVPQYRPLVASPRGNVLETPGVVEITLPSAAELKLWSNLDPLEQGVADFPPSLEDSRLNDRVITWLRIQASPGVGARLLWIGINTVGVTQRAHVTNELLPDGTGAPDQSVVLSRKPVIPKSVQLTVSPPAGETQTWQEIEDLLSAGPEVLVPDLRQPPGAAAVPTAAG